MSTITYQNISNDTPADANVLNERFGQIVNEINGNLDSTNIKDGAITLAKVSNEIYEKMYPIGSVYINASVDTNPGVLLGFGTWEAFGKGRVLVGKADSGTFVSAGTELGAETETLTWNQMPVHNHGVNDPGHSHSVSWTGSNSDIVTNARDIEWSHSVDSLSRQTSHNWTGISIQNAGGGQAHNNIQPSVVVYMWRRTG